MRIQDKPPIHLTYCLNVHPGESWDENFAAIRDKVLAVRDLAGKGRPFGLGLRLSAQAAEELLADGRIDELRRFLDRESLYVFTINGFPYGQFHGTAVKQNVYAPDWRHAPRLEYTTNLADILARLLPEGVPGSISTVPLSYNAWIKNDYEVERMARLLAAAAGYLYELRQHLGRDICLALEPEPDCFIETTDQVTGFLKGAGGDFMIDRLERRLGVKRLAAEEALRTHLGVCLDTAHAAVEFEDVAESLAFMAASRVRIGKVQLSSALRLSPTEEALRRLREFVDATYLHQVKVRKADGTIVSYPDLPDALAGERPAPQDEWRVHYHVPLFFQESGGLASTSDLLTGELAGYLRAGKCPNLEIETYTWNVLPEFLRPIDLPAGIAGEYRWVMKNVLA